MILQLLFTYAPPFQAMFGEAEELVIRTSAALRTGRALDGQALLRTNLMLGKLSIIGAVAAILNRSESARAGDLAADHGAHIRMIAGGFSCPLARISARASTNRDPAWMVGDFAGNRSNGRVVHSPGSGASGGPPRCVWS